MPSVVLLSLSLSQSFTSHLLSRYLSFTRICHARLS